MRDRFATLLLLLLPLLSVAMAASPAWGERLLESGSLNLCQQESSFTASLFNFIYTPGNGTATVNIVATSSIQGMVLFDLTVFTYGYQAIRRILNPCNMEDLAGLCPMSAGKITFTFNVPIDQKAASQIPEIAYNIPDLDATARVYINLTSDGESRRVACVEANISNGKTVNLLGLEWATAIIAGLAMLASAVISGLGHSHAAAHIAANSLSLFGYFQAQAILGLSSLRLPPIVQAWTMNFQWSLGIIRVAPMQTVLSWFQRATGGTPSSVLDSLRTMSVQVAKRSVQTTGLDDLVRASLIGKRGDVGPGRGAYAVYGIKRVAFRSRIESTNLFMTVIFFYYLFVLLLLAVVLASKGFCELAINKRWIDQRRFLDFRTNWRLVVKGMLLRITLFSFPQIAIFCFWEFTQADSPAEVAMAALILLGTAFSLAWASAIVIRLAYQSDLTYGNPAVVLFSNSKTLCQLGFLYIQFRASAYYFIVPLICHVLVKAMLTSFAQDANAVQAVGLTLLEVALLIASSVLRPWMDKSTNSFNIAIYAVNFVNAILLFIFSNIMNAPALFIGIVGVVLFILNAGFMFILLVMVIVSTTLTLFRKNPDALYQSITDDRASFIKSQTHLDRAMELEDLAATARGSGTSLHKA